MDEKSGDQKGMAEHDVRDGVVARPVTSASAARQDALRRYLGAESYHEKRIEQTESGSSAREDKS